MSKCARENLWFNQLKVYSCTERKSIIVKFRVVICVNKKKS